ncbi:hypothetical protein CTZ27_29200 [Streptomyces griseocarneus]|nr:hypothetical protein CTZ27_29200 [Streptomyces griseocarneus]
MEDPAGGGHEGRGAGVVLLGQRVTGSSTAVAGQVVTPAVGIVHHGRFHGRKLLQVIPVLQPGLLECLGNGFTSAAGVTTLTIS